MILLNIINVCLKWIITDTHLTYLNIRPININNLRKILKFANTLSTRSIF